MPKKQKEITKQDVPVTQAELTVFSLMAEAESKEVETV
jgi:hypothetical protein